jgi:hypothetical protein
VALTGVLLTVVTSPVLVADTEPIIITMCIDHTSSTVLTVWAVTDLSLVRVAMGITRSDILNTVLSSPVLVADAVPMVVEVCILHTLLTVAVAWAEAAVTLVVTESLVDRTVISCPPVVTDAGGCSIGQIDKMSVVDT